MLLVSKVRLNKTMTSSQHDALLRASVAVVGRNVDAGDWNPAVDMGTGVPPARIPLSWVSNNPSALAAWT